LLTPQNCIPERGDGRVIQEGAILSQVERVFVVDRISLVWERGSCFRIESPYEIVRKGVGTTREMLEGLAMRRT
jgi:hypothetical protein